MSSFSLNGGSTVEKKKTFSYSKESASKRVHGNDPNQEFLR